MSDIIAGDPAPTNPTDAIRADILAGLRIAEDGSVGDETPEELLYRYDVAKRAEVLAEAIEAARSEYLTDSTGESEDDSYNQAVTDVIAGIEAIADGGGSRG
jgi:hypothetical protein